MFFGIFSCFWKVSKLGSLDSCCLSKGTSFFIKNMLLQWNVLRTRKPFFFVCLFGLNALESFFVFVHSSIKSNSVMKFPFVRWISRTCGWLSFVFVSATGKKKSTAFIFPEKFCDLVATLFRNSSPKFAAACNWSMIFLIFSKRANAINFREKTQSLTSAADTSKLLLILPKIFENQNL